MPNFERNLRQTLTYWEQDGTDQYNKPNLISPVQLPCRWEDNIELVIDKHGQEFKSKSRIFLAVPIRAEGYVLQGAFTEWLLQGGFWDVNGVWIDEATWSGGLISPLRIRGIQEVRQVKGVPDLRNMKQMYTVWL